VVRAQETRYRVPGWGAGALWTSARAVLAHEFTFDAGAAVEQPQETHPDGNVRAGARARALEGAASPPLGTLAGERTREAHGLVSSPHGDSPAATLDADALVASVVEYLAGGEVSFDGVPLDLGGWTPFQRAVATSLRAIPRGDVIGYGELAALAGYPGAARAVGTFCARNAFAFFVPCHRVVAAEGIGGYGSAGVAVKRRLLALEGVSGLAA